jgi:hypothetical protein
MMIQLLAAAAVGNGATPVETLSGESISSTEQDPANAETGIKFQSTGGVQRWITPSYSSIDTATDWVRPTAYAGQDYEVRYTNLVGDAFTTSAAAEDAWVAISTDPVWKLLQNVVGTSTCTCDFEIRDADDVTVASASYTFTSIVDSGG